MSSEVAGTQWVTFSWFDGRWTSTDEPVLAVSDRGVLFGDAVYEVLKFIGRAPILVDAHWQRLCRSLEMMEIRNPWSEESFRNVMAELLRRTEHEAGIVYLQVSRGGRTRSHAWDDAVEPVDVHAREHVPFPGRGDAARGDRGRPCPGNALGSLRDQVGEPAA